MKKFILTMLLIVNLHCWTIGFTMLKLPHQAFWIENHWINHIKQGKPRHWRALNEYAISPSKKKMNTTGLNSLFISGSASPTLDNLYWLKNHYGQERTVLLIDLRQETHLYVNGLPISIFDRQDQINWGKSPERINDEEHAWLEHTLKQQKITLNLTKKSKNGFKIPINPFILNVKFAYLEKEAAAKADLHYYRIEVPDYHPPSPSQVDQFIKILHSVPEHYWIHFHCAGGKGRTTTFLAITDIIYNYKQISLNDIIMRQVLMGGIDLLDDSPTSLKDQPWKKEYKTARKNFIHLFYNYVIEAYPKESYTSWSTRQPEGPYFKLLQSQAYFHI